MYKKVLLFGPIGEFGGRDVEVNIIAKSLEDSFDVSVFSTIYISNKSYALADLKKISFSSFNQKIYNSSWVLRLICGLFFLKNKKQKLPYAYIKNTISKLFFNFEREKQHILYDEAQNADIIIACVQLTSSYLKEIIEISHQLNIPFFVRTTGTIRKFDIDSFSFLKKVTCFIHHSEKNASLLNSQMALPYEVIDQCAQFEEKLLALQIKENKKTYGFLGRLSQEKGIIELIQNFKTQKESILIIAGNGPLKNEVQTEIEGYNNIQYIGQCQPKDLFQFFDKIDVLIISSYEESGPLVGLEAMAAGKIIISTDVGAMKDRLIDTENNFWFDITSKTSLIENVNAINQLTNQNFTNIATQNRKKYLKEYQFQEIKNKYIFLCKSFIK